MPQAQHGTFKRALGKWFGTDGYVLRNSAARELLAATVPIEGHVDNVLTRMEAIGKTPPIWRTQPRWTGVKQTLGLSTTGGDVLSLRRMLPDNNAASNALIITPWAVLLAVLITVVVLAALGFALVRKPRRPRAVRARH